MNKSELIDAIAKDANITKVAAKAALESFISNVTSTLKKKDGKVSLVGFGTFSVAERAARQGINPATKQLWVLRKNNRSIILKIKPRQWRGFFCDRDVRFGIQVS